MRVIDASVAFKWIKREKETDRDIALRILQEHLENRKKIIVPSLIYLEVANAITTKTKSSGKTIEKSLRCLNEMDLQVDSFTKTDYIEAAILAKKYRTTVYDMLYAVIAKKLRTVLITADQSFIKKTKFPFVKPLSEYRSSNEI